MAVETFRLDVINNIYTFANILSSANTDLVKCWDQTSLIKALKWAAYCKKIENETRDCTFRDDLDFQIQRMTIFLKPVSLLKLSLDKLSDAPYLLCKSLLQNPCTPAPVMTKLVDNFESSAKQHVRHMDKNKMKSDYKLYQLLGEDISFMDQNDRSQAFHIMSRLTTLQKLCFSCQSRYDKFVEKIVMELVKFRNGWTVTIYMILVEVVSELDHDVVTGIKKKLMAAVTTMARDLTCGLWTCKLSLLSEVCRVDEKFADIYINHLIAWTQDMVPVYRVQENGDIYFWRYKDSNLSDRYSYTDLQKHIVEIFKNERTLQRKVEVALIEMSSLCYFNIFKDLLSVCHGM